MVSTQRVENLSLSHKIVSRTIVSEGSSIQWERYKELERVCALEVTERRKAGEVSCVQCCVRQKDKSAEAILEPATQGPWETVTAAVWMEGCGWKLDGVDWREIVKQRSGKSNYSHYFQNVLLWRGAEKWEENLKGIAGFYFFSKDRWQRVWVLTGNV